jgi:hypothetical protein
METTVTDQAPDLRSSTLSTRSWEGGKLWGAQLTAATWSFARPGASVVAHEALVYIQANGAVLQILRKLQIKKIPPM